MVAEVDVAVVGAIKAVEVLMRRLWALQFAWVLMTICLKRATMVSPLSQHHSMVVPLLMFLHCHIKTTSKVIIRKSTLQEAEAVIEVDIDHPLTPSAIIVAVAEKVSQIREETSTTEETAAICTQMVSSLAIIIIASSEISRIIEAILLLSLLVICLQNLELRTQA